MKLFFLPFNNLAMIASQQVVAAAAVGINPFVPK